MRPRDKRQGSGQAPQKLRNRFVARARFLRQHQPYLSALAEAISKWDADYPQFAIGRRTHVPDEPFPSDDLLGTTTLGYVLPSLLHAAAQRSVQEAIARSWEAHRAGERSVWRQDETVLLAEGEWSQRIQELCTSWFPPGDYPSWRGRFTHPATRFVSACMIWQPLEISEYWIDDTGIEIHRIAYDPRDPAQSSHARMWRQAWANLQVRLSLAFMGMPAFTPEVVNTLMLDSFATAWREAQQFDAGVEPTLFIILPPGMTTGDWRAMEAAAVTAAERPLHQRVRYLREAGKSQEQIASILGISRRRVAQLLGLTAAP